MLKKAQINEYGEIEWPYLEKQADRQALRRETGAFFDGYSQRHISHPSNLVRVKVTIAFAKKHEIQIRPYKKLGLSIENPRVLIDYFLEKRYTMSKAESYTEEFEQELKRAPSAFIKAGVLYAIHTRNCIIADLERRDRQAVALIALYQLQGFPALLICRKKDREDWKAQIDAWLPDVEVLDFRENGNPNTKEKIYLMDYEKLSDRADFHFNKKYYSVIVDRALFIKNSETLRTKRVQELMKNRTYRFLLTDSPVNISATDLPELLKALGKWDEFEKQKDFLEKSRRDPLDEHHSSFFQVKRERKWRELYYQLRTNCMVRRADDPGLHTKIERVGVKALRYSEEFDRMDIRSALRQMGIYKLKDSIRKIREYREEYPEEKTLILAHHNDVVRELMSQLDIPAIYGKINSDTQRETLARRFRIAPAPALLILANDVEPIWGFGQVDRIIYVELNTTPQKYENLIVHLLRNRKDARLNIVFLYTNYPNDLEALQRLELREKLAEKVLDKR